MATLTLRYDARNSFAKKTIDYILSLGLFEVEDTVKKSKKSLSKEEFIAKISKETNKKLTKRFLEVNEIAQK